MYSVEDWTWYDYTYFHDVPPQGSLASICKIQDVLKRSFALSPPCTVCILELLQVLILNNGKIHRMNESYCTHLGDSFELSSLETTEIACFKDSKKIQASFDFEELSGYNLVSR